MRVRKNKIIAETINLLLNILLGIFCVVLLISIYTTVQIKVLGNDYNDFFGYSMFEVQTGSMADEINAGDWVVVKLTQNVKLDDVVTFELDGEYITHRIIEVYNSTYVTKGDANSAKDKPIDQNQIIGKVVKVLPNLGFIRKTLLNAGVLMALIITLFLFNMAFMGNKSNSSKTKASKDNKEVNSYALVNEIVKKIGLLLSEFKGFKKDKKVERKTKLVDEDLEDIEIEYDEEKEAELEKTSLYRVVSVNANDVDEKYKELSRKIEVDEVEDETVKETDLEKTALYRVISVDVGEVDDKYKDVNKNIAGDSINKTDEDNLDSTEEELEKTSIFRVISVDADEVDNTLLEVAENEMKEPKQNDKKQETDIEEEEPNIEEEDLTKIDFNLLKQGSRKNENVIDSAMLVKENELDKLVSTLIEDEKKYVNQATVKNTFITTYINVKYYSYYDDKNINYNGKKSVLKLESIIKDLSNELISEYRGSNSKYKDTVDIYSRTFILIAKLEHAADSITDSKAKNEFYKKEVALYLNIDGKRKIKSIVDELIETQKKYNNMLEDFLKKLDTNMFNLSFNRLVTKKNMYGLELTHNISFSKVYSDYIIDKTYTEGIVAEDKMSVLLTLLSRQLIKDMISANFNRKYILYIPNSLYTKERKFKRILRAIDDDYAKDNVIILITLEDLLNNKKIIKEAKKLGYKFALVFDKENMIKEKDRSNIYIVDYIFANKKVFNKKVIPEDLLDNVIYEDIVDKIGDFGSE